MQDNHWMGQALELAKRGIALASPNPCVGAVVVTGDEVIGTGCYTYEGTTHAEIQALQEAGERARGATLYLTLEPCSHTGRTGPCADAVIESGVRRVVAAMQDPNPLVSGKGFEKLRAAGIDLTVGVLQDEAQRLIEGFAKYIRTKRPLVLLKAAMTLDGKIAPPPGESENPSALGAGGATGGWITSEVAREHVQQLRHASDAVMVGVGTIVADDPLLTDRSGKPRRRPLLRVILDSRLRLPVDSRLVKTCKDDVIVFCAFAEEKKKRELEERGVRIEQAPLFSSTERQIPLPNQGPMIWTQPRNDGRPDLEKIIERLGELEITSVLIEGGAMVNWTALAAGLVDKVFLYYAPKILAGTGAVPFAAGAGFRRMSDAAQIKKLSIHRFGDDFAVEGYIRDPYEAVGPRPGPINEENECSPV